MNRCRLPYIIRFVVAFLFFFSSCASGPPIRGSENAPPPEIKITPEIELTGISVNNRFKAAIDYKGLAHVIVPASDTGELYHLLVDERGTLQKEVVKKSGSYDRIDMAFDQKGDLYAIVDDDHLVLRDGKWQTFSKLPKDRCKWSALSGKNIVCADEVKGEEVGSSSRWDWYFGGFGGYGGAIVWILPWHTHAQRIIICIGNDAAWTNGVILDPTEELDEYLSSVSTDDEGTIHIVYGSYDTDLPMSMKLIQRVAKGDTRYARIDPSIMSENKGNARDLLKVEGLRIAWEQPLSFAIDPKSGIILIVTRDQNSQFYKTQTIKYPSLDRSLQTNFFSGRIFSSIHILPMGQGEFQALVDGHYFMYKDNVWSAPVKLTGITGKGKTEFVSDRSGRALAIWQGENNKLVGQWIQPTR